MPDIMFQAPTSSHHLLTHIPLVSLTRLSIRTSTCFMESKDWHISRPAQISLSYTPSLLATLCAASLSLFRSRPTPSTHSLSRSRSLGGLAPPIQRVRHDSYTRSLHHLILITSIFKSNMRRDPYCLCSSTVIPSGFCLNSMSFVLSPLTSLSSVRYIT